jgi:hypothetical protein
MKKEEIEKEIRENWFKEHVAEFEKLNDRISILNWYLIQVSIIADMYLMVQDFILVAI